MKRYAVLYTVLRFIQEHAPVLQQCFMTRPTDVLNSILSLCRHKVGPQCLCALRCVHFAVYTSLCTLRCVHTKHFTTRQVYFWSLDGTLTFLQLSRVDRTSAGLLGLHHLILLCLSWNSIPWCSLLVATALLALMKSAKERHRQTVLTTHRARTPAFQSAHCLLPLSLSR